MNLTSATYYSKFPVLKAIGSVLLLFSLYGCPGSFVPESTKPPIIINPAVIDFSSILTSGSVKVRIQSFVNKRIVVDTMYTTAQGLIVRGLTPFVLDSLGVYDLSIDFDWRSFRDPGNVALVVQTDLPGFERIETAIIVPSSREETKITGEPGVNSNLAHLPVKFSGNGALILHNRYHRIPESGYFRFDVYTMNIIGEEVRRLTNSLPGENSHGVDISEFGTSVLFYTDSLDGSRNMYLWTEAGIDTLTRDNFINTPVALSPNGRRVLFHSNRATGLDTDVYYMELSSKQVVRLTNTTNDETAVSWNNDGTRVLIKGIVSDRSDVLLSTLVGTPLRLTASSSIDEEPVAFSPDGGRILFYSNKNFKREIYTMTISGNDVVQLTSNQLFDYPLKYTSDGLQIVFYTYDYGNNTDIFMMDSKGGLQSIRKITALPSSEIPVDISPDGKIILFYSKRVNGTTGSDIFTIRTD